MRVYPSPEIESVNEIQLDDDLLIHADNGLVLSKLPSRAIQLIYIDPRFNTGRDQTRIELSVVATVDGERIGFGGRQYRSTVRRRLAYSDTYVDYLGFVEPRLREA